MDKTELENSLPEYLTQPIKIECPQSETIEKFCEIHARGRKLNDEIHRNRRINNPYYVANALESYKIDQKASNIVSKKRQRLMNYFEQDSIEALRNYKRNKRANASTMDAEKSSDVKEQPVGKEGMTSEQQAAISQFVIDAQERLQHITKKPNRFQ